MTKTEKILAVLALSLYALLLLSPPREGSLEHREPTERSIPAAVTVGGIDLNTADGETLMLLPGVGEVTAEKIVLWREEHGGFSCVEDLILVEGIGEKTMMKIYEYEEEQ